MWKRIWAKQVADGDLWNWSLFYRRTGEGPNFVAVQVFPEGVSEQRPQLNGNSIPGIFPELKPEEVGARLRETGQVRDLTGVEKWTLVESLATSK